MATHVIKQDNRSLDMPWDSSNCIQKIPQACGKFAIKNYMVNYFRFFFTQGAKLVFDTRVANSKESLLGALCATRQTKLIVVKAVNWCTDDSMRLD